MRLKLSIHTQRSSLAFDDVQVMKGRKSFFKLYHLRAFNITGTSMCGLHSELRIDKYWTICNLNLCIADSMYLHEHVLFIDIPSTHTYIHCFLTVIT